MDLPNRQPALSSAQRRELAGLVLLVVGCLGLLVVAARVDPLAVVALLSAGAIYGGFLLASSSGGEDR